MKFNQFCNHWYPRYLHLYFPRSWIHFWKSGHPLVMIKIDQSWTFIIIIFSQVELLDGHAAYFENLIKDNRTGNIWIKSEVSIVFPIMPNCTSSEGFFDCAIDHVKLQKEHIVIFRDILFIEFTIHPEHIIYRISRSMSEI